LPPIALTSLPAASGVLRSKISVSPLGVDTELFNPISTERGPQNSLSLHRRFGFCDSEIVYDGRFNEDRNPLLLAQAVAQLVSTGLPYRGLSVENGEQAHAIQTCAGCATNPFVLVGELGEYYPLRILAFGRRKNLNR